VIHPAHRLPAPGCGGKQYIASGQAGRCDADMGRRYGEGPKVLNIPTGGHCTCSRCRNPPCIEISLARSTSRMCLLPAVPCCARCRSGSQSLVCIDASAPPRHGTSGLRCCRQTQHSVLSMYHFDGKQQRMMTGFERARLQGIARNIATRSRLPNGCDERHGFTGSRRPRYDQPASCWWSNAAIAAGLPTCPRVLTSRSPTWRRRISTFCITTTCKPTSSTPTGYVADLLDGKVRARWYGRRRSRSLSLSIRRRG